MARLMQSVSVMQPLDGSHEQAKRQKPEERLRAKWVRSGFWREWQTNGRDRFASRARHDAPASRTANWWTRPSLRGVRLENTVGTSNVTREFGSITGVTDAPVLVYGDSWRYSDSLVVGSFSAVSHEKVGLRQSLPESRSVRASDAATVTVALREGNLPLFTLVEGQAIPR